MRSVTTVADLKPVLAELRAAGGRLALVPTMGNLHAGHRALVQRAQALAEHVAVSLFVNPMQFVAGEDFARYPRTLAEDQSLLAKAGVDLLFAPAPTEVYPQGVEAHTQVTVPTLDGDLCGAFRPGHFRGVATVVAQLFNRFRPEVAVFGQKDYQQFLLIRRMARDLAFDIELEAVPTVREADGLALSSRNAYLNAAERRLAPRLYGQLRRVAEALSADGDCAALEAEAAAALASAGFRVEYVAIRRAADLGTPERGDEALAVLAAAWLGRTRLIDNVLTSRGAVYG